MEDIKITLIANAGVLVEWGGVRYLIDGIHTNDNLQFDAVPDDLLGEMLLGTGSMSDIDYLLFTHEHIDHFMAGLTQTYLQNNNVKAIVVPSHGGHRLESLKEYARYTGIECIDPEIADGEAFEAALGNAKLTIIGMRHMGEQFRMVQSCSFLLDFGGKALLFTGDSDYNAEKFRSGLAGKHVDVMFVNPLFYLSKEGKSIMAEIAPSTVMVYHLAAKTDGKPSAYERGIQLDAEKYQPLPYRLIQLDEMGMQITL